MRQKQKQFWEVFYKDDTRECEVRGPSFNDTKFTNMVCEIQDAGLRVHCQTITCDSRSLEQVIDGLRVQPGYKHVDGLFNDTYINRNNSSKVES